MLPKTLVPVPIKFNEGNTAAWVKFANSLKLRMAMRTCYVSGFNVDGKSSQQLAEEAYAVAE